MTLLKKLRAKDGKVVCSFPFRAPRSMTGMENAAPTSSSAVGCCRSLIAEYRLRVLTDSTQESFPGQLHRLQLRCCANFDLLCTGLRVDVGIKLLPGTDSHVAMLEVSLSRWQIGPRSLSHYRVPEPRCILYRKKVAWQSLVWWNPWANSSK